MGTITSSEAQMPRNRLPLYALLSALKEGTVSEAEASKRLSCSPHWVWGAIDPVSKLPTACGSAKVSHVRTSSTRTTGRAGTRTPRRHDDAHDGRPCDSAG